MADEPAPAAASKVGLEAKSPFEMRVNLGNEVPETDVRTALADGHMGFVHSFTTGSAVDGPGVRVVAWTTGCMWRCLYCHNPDTWTMRNGIPVSAAHALEQLGKYRHGLKVMAGGLTVSGGEPLMQRLFVMKLIAGAKAMGIHTAIETNGYLSPELSDEDLAQIDLVLLGFKAWGTEKHKTLTGRGPEHTLEFAQRLSAVKKPVWIRFVLVPGLTDDSEDLKAMASYVAGLGNVQRVEVLPFHQMGRYKWHELGMRYKLEDTLPPTNEQHQAACAIFRAAGLEAY
jgi:pyruvate formate lyase activating enzyme